MTRVVALPFAMILLAAAAFAADRSKADALFAKRADPKSLEAALEAYEQAGEHVMAARCAFLRIDLHEDLADDEDAREKWIERGLKSAVKALGGDEPEKRLSAMKKE